VRGKIGGWKCRFSGWQRAAQMRHAPADRMAATPNRLAGRLTRSRAVVKYRDISVASGGAEKNHNGCPIRRVGQPLRTLPGSTASEKMAFPSGRILGRAMHLRARQRTSLPRSSLRDALDRSDRVRPRPIDTSPCLRQGRGVFRTRGREWRAQARSRRRSNRPGISQAEGPRGQDALESVRRRPYGLRRTTEGVSGNQSPAKALRFHRQRGRGSFGSPPAGKRRLGDWIR
jgi:hypothetical protein